MKKTIKEYFEKKLGLEEIGIIEKDETATNDLFGMFLLANEIIYAVFYRKKQSRSYAFTNKAIIMRDITEDKRETIQRFPFEAYQVSDVSIYQGDNDIDVEVQFKLNKYNSKNHAGRAAIQAHEDTLYINESYYKDALFLYKLLSLIEEKQKEQNMFEQKRENVVITLLQNRNYSQVPLKEEIEQATDYLETKVYISQFKDISQLYEDVEVSSLEHEKRKSASLGKNYKRPEDEVEIVEAEIVE